MMIKTKNRTLYGFSVGDKFRVMESGPWSGSSNLTLQIVEILPCRPSRMECPLCEQKDLIKYIYTNGKAKVGVSNCRERCSFNANAHKLERI